tara:strand:- start:1295 stop:2044 length:750 start_codon:yes stop_codon:yes gene_type:complete
MATLTYNPEEPQAEEFTEEEQANIAVGEQLEQQEEALLAGKFKDAEDLERAYIELQSKLGKPQEEQQEEQAPEEEEVSEETENFLNQLWEESQTNEYSEDTVNRLRTMNPAELAKMYLEERNSKPTAPSIDEKSASSLRETVGGDNAYTNMINWARDNLNDKESEMYNSVMESGNPNSMFFAIQALNARYTNSTGFEGEMITGKGTSQTVDNYKSQAEVVRAMSDERYDVDPAYRAQVAQKLERSNLEF